MGSLLSRCFGLCSSNCCKQSILKREPSFSSILAIPDHQQIEGIQPKLYSWDNREKVNASDYTVSDLQGGEQVVKRPGDINGQQFIIKNCSNSNIYVLDWSSQVTIDDCSNCLIVLGPVQGSIFLRDTTNTTLVSASSQLRLRDCTSIHLFVGSESDPIIEASTDIIVAPYYLSYNGIKEQFTSAKLSRFKAVHWSEIYDFTPNPNEMTPNWKRYDRGKHAPEKYVCPPQPSHEFSDLGMTIGDPWGSAIPVTHPSEDLLPRGVNNWRRHEVLFTQEPGQGQETGQRLEQLMEKFYMDKIVCGQGQWGPSAGGDISNTSTIVLCDIQSKKNQYTIIYLQLQQ